MVYNSPCFVNFMSDEDLILIGKVPTKCRICGALGYIVQLHAIMQAENGVTG